jgi:hypothetical protein
MVEYARSQGVGITSTCRDTGCHKANGPKVKGPERGASIDDSKLKRKGGKVSKRLARNLYTRSTGSLRSHAR